MVLVHYDEDLTMREARAIYFEVNAFGADGGYGDAWVDFKLGPLPVPFPNTRARVRAVRFHDLHHVLTGYDTSTIGEFEISAWELGAGCKDFVAAWQLNLGGLVAGLVSAPRRTVRAFLRGRRSESLYGRPFEALLDRTVGDLRREMRVDEPVAGPTAGDVLTLALASLGGLVSAAIGLPAVVAVTPIGLATLALRRRRAQRAAEAGA
ncbi:hypothetical protein SOCEGT47_083660 [Sorangium cellulosum]|uniref:Ubiquinone biosynthesis protein n=1 Tax=Sorangium cellulosum TaxID=56 RepID=A0A4P2QED6_SORCE|nr:hypothetical protein [Sorangium cellulosum]AUX27768.1 hypothetical protein SOCEGT47_083660 [Sorangium cellulosum]